jgi:hypothetical protein
MHTALVTEPLLRCTVSVECAALSLAAVVVMLVVVVVLYAVHCTWAQQHVVHSHNDCI